jgi:hypothetical protein
VFSFFVSYEIVSVSSFQLFTQNKININNPPFSFFILTSADANEDYECDGNITIMDSGAPSGMQVCVITALFKVRCLVV